METVGWLLCALLFIQVVFQTKLATGAPLGHLAYGGKHKGKLPEKYRIISAVAVIVYLFLFTVALTYAADISIYSDRVTSVVLWAMAVFFGFGTFANAASRSKPERWWAVYTTIALLCVLYLM